MSIAVLNRSSLPDSDVDAFARAVDAQLRDDFCPRWPTVLYQPVVFSATAPVGAATVITIMDDDPHPPDNMAIVVGQTTSLDLSHLVLAWAADPTSTTFLPTPDGRSVALDPTDPMEGYTYQKIVLDSNGDERSVTVGHFVLPSWYNVVAPVAVHDSIGSFKMSPWTLPPGGFLSIRELNGQITRICGVASRLPRAAERADMPSSRLSARGGNKNAAPVVARGTLFVAQAIAVARQDPPTRGG